MSVKRDKNAENVQKINNNVQKCHLTQSVWKNPGAFFMATKNVNLENEAAVEMTEDEKKATVRKYENDILGGLMAAAAYKTDAEEAVPIEIKRNGAVVLSFRIRPMGENEYVQCKKDNTNYKRNKQLGTRVAESVDAARYRAQLIYEATVEEDRDKIWDNRDAWKNLNVLNGIDLVEVVLKSGEKDEILAKLDEISGYQPTMEDVAKN